jgi:hypothetical protein
MSIMSTIMMKTQQIMDMMYKNRGQNVGMMGGNNENGMNNKTK